MSNPVSFINSYTNNIVALTNLLATLRLQNDMLTQDPTLVTRYFDQTKNPSQRTDIAAADVTAAQAAIVQLLFTFDSGSPTEKAALFKMLP